MLLTHNSWYTVTETSFFIRGSTQAQRPLSFRSECIRAAKLIFENTYLPIRVCLSGGLDSQVVALAFKHAGVPFEVCTIRLLFGGGVVNQHDLDNANLLAVSMGLKPTVIEVNTEDIFEAIYSGKRSATNHNHVMHNLLCERDSSVCWVLGVGPQDRLYYRPQVRKYGLVYEESATQRGLGLSDQSVSFFFYTPELFCAFSDCEEFRLANQALPGLHASLVHYNGHLKDIHTRRLGFRQNELVNAWVKPGVFHSAWPELISTPKFHGFEAIPLDVLVPSIEKLNDSNRLTPYIVLPYPDVLQATKTNETTAFKLKEVYDPSVDQR